MASTVTNNLKKLSHKAFRALLKKFRRKKKRQLLAQERERQEKVEQEKKENSPNFKEREEEKQRSAKLWDEYQERERIRKHKEWLNREALAQYEFEKKKIHRELEIAKKDEERKRMLAELEEQNAISVAAADKTKNEKAKKEEALQAALSGLPESNGPWHNPIAPENYRTDREVLRDECQFFTKTGCCRFGDMCSRGHNNPDVSCTILIKGMFSHFSISQSHRDDYDTDMGLEFEESETYDDFIEFYHDVLPEFKTCGNVVQFKVCCNHEPHLRGNVYVQFSREKEAMKAFQKFNGRFYAGKQLTCQFTNVIKWRSAICGLFASNSCPKGDHCNFLHVFRNPKGEYWAADRDLPARQNGRSRFYHRGSSPQHSRHSDSRHSSRSRNESERSSRNHSRLSDSSRRENERHSSRSRKRQYSSDSNSSGEVDERTRSRNSERIDHDRCSSDRHIRHRTRSASSTDSRSGSESVPSSSSKSKKKKKKHKKSKKKKKRAERSPS